MSGLTCTSLRRVRRPAYPTKLQILATPGLLEKRLPPAWAGNRELAAAVGVFLAANAAGCGDSVAKKQTGRTNQEIQAQAATSAESSSQSVADDQEHSVVRDGRGSGVGKKARLAADAPAIVAPILRRGEGLASVGCVVINPPAMLSEEQAFEVIIDELRVYGIDLSERNATLESVLVKRHVVEHGYDWVDDQKVTHVLGVDESLVVDGLDRQNQIAIEYISWKDYDEFDGPWQHHHFSTAYIVETRAVAKAVAAQIAEQPAGLYFGVFYDPYMLSDEEMDYAGFLDMTRAKPPAENRDALIREWRDKWDRATILDENGAKQVLREQVKDFVDWLKAQGVI